MNININQLIIVKINVIILYHRGSTAFVNHQSDYALASIAARCSQVLSEERKQESVDETGWQKREQKAAVL